MTVAAPRDHRFDELAAGESLTAEGFAHDLAKSVELLWSHTEVALPAGPLPRSARGYQREERAGIFRGEEVERAAHRPRLDDSTFAERTRDFAGFRSLASHAHAELGVRGDLRLDAAQTANHRRDRLIPHRIEKVPAHPPGEGLRPRHPGPHRRRLTRDCCDGRYVGLC